MRMKEKSLSQTSEQDEGKVYFIKTDKGLFPLSVLRGAEKKPKTEQIKPKKWLTEHGMVPHPFNVDGLLTLEENSSYFDACVRQIAQDVVGQGWEIKVKEGVKEHKEEDRQRVKDFLLDPNETDEDITDIIKKAMVDWGSVGWWGLEVERDPPIEGKVIGLWQIPAHTLYINEDMMRYAQLRNAKRVWFTKYGSGLRISSKTGKEVKGKKNLAHELIYQFEYYQKSDYYGRPNILPAVGAVMGLIGVRDYNLAFFDNYGVPAALVVLTGRWSAEAARQITNFLDVEIKGSSNAHKTLVLKPPANGKVEWKPLNVKTEEAGFKLYLKILRDEVLSAYKMPPYRIGIAETGSLGGSIAGESTKIYAQSIIQPLKMLTGRIITNKVVRDGLDIKDFYFEWNKLDTRDHDALVKRLQILFMMGAVTPNQIRKEMGWEPRKDPEGNQYYIAANFLPAGEESVEKREAIMMAALEELGGKIQTFIDSDQEGKERFNQIINEGKED
jgi:PBSX family phage portal protein